MCVESHDIARAGSVVASDEEKTGVAVGDHQLVEFDIGCGGFIVAVSGAAEQKLLTFAEAARYERFRNRVTIAISLYYLRGSLIF